MPDGLVVILFFIGLSVTIGRAYGLGVQVFVKEKLSDT